MSVQSPAGDARANNVTVRYWAAARAAAGVETEQVDATTLAELTAEVVRRRPGDRRFADVLAICSVLVGEVPVGGREHRDVTLDDGATIEFLPPFAGG